ncbi:MAG: hypothetical protein FK733_17580 [Asgard group archaeon]|nr:hypothetical protein [Asgard group archaeon]
MTDNMWKKYKKGVKYLKKNGLLLRIKLPPGGETEWIVANPGFALEDFDKEKLSKPFKLQTSDGKTIQLSVEFMDRLKIITGLDLQRIIRNSSIILTDFTGPKDEDTYGNHYQRLKNWKADDIKTKQTEFVVTLFMLDSLEGSKEPLPNQHYLEAATIIGFVYKLW